MRIKEQESQPLRAAAYIRVSTALEEQEYSYDSQKKYFEELLAKNKQYKNAGIYSDYGISGTSLKKRDGLQSLLLDCKKGRVNRIYCKSLSRFARNSLEFLQILSVLRESGVTVYFEKENLDTVKSLNDIVVTTLAAIAEEESISVSENIRWSNSKRYASGEVPNEPIYGYRWTDSETVMLSGYKYRNIEVVPEEALVVRRIFEEVADGKTYVDVARALNTDNIIPPLKKGDGSGKSEHCKKWHSRHIYSIISNERYTGCVRTQKSYVADPLKHNVKRNKGNLKQYVVNNHHLAIISNELFDIVQCAIRRNSKNHGNNDTGAKRTQTLSGLLVCHTCGKKLNCNGRNRIPYWFCPGEECNLRIEEGTIFKMLEKAICIRFDEGNDLGDNIRKMYDEIDHLTGQKNQINNDLVAAQARLDSLEKQVTMLENRLLNISDAKTREVMTRSINLLSVQLTEEEKNVELLLKKIEQCNSIAQKSFQLYDVQEEIMSVIESVSSFEEKLKKILHNNIRGIIAKVIVHSSAELSVWWLDNSVTKVCGGA